MSYDYKHQYKYISSLFNSERSDECIDFTMLCVFIIFFVSVYTRTCRNNASMLQLQTLGLVHCEGHFLNFSIVYKAPGKTKKKKKKKLRKNGNFYAKSVFDQIDFLYGCNSKTNHCKYLKISPHFYLNFHKFLTFFDVYKKILDDQNILKIEYKFKFYKICRKRENLQILENFTTFEVQILTKIRQNHEFLQIQLRNLNSELFLICLKQIDECIDFTTMCVVKKINTNDLFKINLYGKPTFIIIEEKDLIITQIFSVGNRMATQIHYYQALKKINFFFYNSNEFRNTLEIYSEKMLPCEKLTCFITFILFVFLIIEYVTKLIW
ncbi:Uncharacterized protein FWK35_00004305 [Aphis craccivora]|uniref:Transmembrane protein n=1 Tax=Aphis craccivora TaxID=307492 RepID=A0A6G0ZPN2_APHCR|nr:Uncharacterized protein FWK35_00004305 [Aphis craccivora]